MATVVTFSWERALCHLLLEVLLWLGVVVKTVGLVVLGWWVRLYSPDGGEGCLASHPVLHRVVMREPSRWLAVTRWSVLAKMLPCMRVPVQAGVAEHCTWLLDVP